MASTEITNANDGSSSSFAEQLQKLHQDNHNVTVEEIPDEDDPRPISTQDASISSPPSEKALGKQKAKEPEPNKSQALDTHSEELFPALGAGTKSRGPISPAWGSQKPSSATNGLSGALNGSSPASRASTPSFTTTPALADYGRSVTIPGKTKQSVTFAPSQLMSRDKLKKPMPEIIKDLNKKSKAQISISQNKNGFTFESSGPNDAIVQQSLRDLAKQIGARQSVKIPVPASARPHIIGKQGAVVQDIMKKTGANVQLPKLKETDGPVIEDDDASIEVLVEGDAISAELARREIEAIVKARTANMTTRLRDVPAVFYPFIAGPNNSALELHHKSGDVRVTVPSYHSWSGQGPPALDETTQRPVFTSHPSSHIQVTGNREDVQRVKADIERQVAALRQQLGVKQLPIEKNRHQFVAGDDDSTQRFLKQIGCYVMLPQDPEDSDSVTLIGPHDTLDRGEEEVIKLAMEMQHQLIDIARLHNKAPQGAQAHARAVTNYLRQREAIVQLEKLYSSRIVLPTGSNDPFNWEVFSSDGTASYKAKSDITNIINAHPPSRFRHIPIDPFYHSHLHSNLREQLLQQYGVQLVLPRDEEPELVIVYEGVPQAGSTYETPRQRPSQAEVVQFEQALKQAQELIEALTFGHQPVETKQIDVQPKFTDKVQKYLRSEQRNLPGGTLPIQFLSRGGSSVIRGPADRLAQHIAGIQAFVKAEEQDEKERGHVLSFEFPKKHANQLIGKGGENIRKLREEFDVEIKVNESKDNGGKIDITGPPKKAEAAKFRILNICKKLDDEATHHLRIAPQFHRELIGAAGGQVNRLQERYGVRIQFPRSARSNHDDDTSVVNGSEAGAQKTTRSTQAPDEVIVRGPKKGADAAKEELESLMKYALDNSQTGTISVDRNQLPSLIGSQGREMESIRRETGAKIEVPSAKDAAGASGRVELKIKGSKQQVENAKKLLQEKVKVFDNSITKTITVAKKHHRAIIGSGGANLRDIVTNAGGPAGAREANRTVQIPKADSNDTTIRIEGNKTVVEKIIASIEKLVAEWDNSVTDVVEVAPEKHRQLIGSGGQTRRKLEADLGVAIEVPKESVQGPARSQIKLTGRPEKVVAAKEHISGMFKKPEGATIQVPRNLHHAIADNGRFFARLRNDHQIIVDHDGNRPPTKSASQSSKSNEPLPLISDDVSKDAGHTWSVQEGISASDLPGDIPWILTGPSENILKAKAMIEKALERAKIPSATGYLVLPDPSTYRLVIGSGGSQINSIREKTGCKINVPRSQEPGQAIEISGSREGVEHAKDIILEVVQGRE